MVNVPGPIKEIFKLYGEFQIPYGKVFKLKPKKLWWRLWPPKRKLLRQFNKWINSRTVVDFMHNKMSEMILTGQVKMTELDYTLED